MIIILTATLNPQVLNSGKVPLEAIQTLFGHSNPTTTQIYAKYKAKTFSSEINDLSIMFANELEVDQKE